MACATPMLMSMPSMDKPRVDSMDMKLYEASSGEGSDADESEKDEEAAPTRYHRQSIMPSSPKRQKGSSRGHQRSSSRAMDQAVKQRMRELDQAGWRPEEEEIETILEDDDYAGVDLVSDSEEEGNDDALRRQEESFLINAADLDVQSTSFQGNMDDMHTFDDLAFSANQPSIYASLFGDTQLEPGLDSVDQQRSPKDVSSLEQHQANPPRRVRFEDFDDLDDTDDEPRIHSFPDLFGDDLGLATTFHLADAALLADDASDAGSCWDFDGDQMDLCLDDDGDEDASSISSSSSDSDLDAGETTDEEAIPPACPPPSAIKPKAAGPAPGSAAKSQTSSSKRRRSSSERENASGNARLPVSGTFTLDPSRPVLLIDGSGRTQRNIIYPARVQSAVDRKGWRRLHSLYSSRATSPLSSILRPSPDLELDFDSLAPSEADSASVNRIFDDFGSLRADQVIGPPEAFMPFTSIEASGSIAADTNDSIMSGSDIDEDDYLTLVNLGDSEDESETEAEGRDSDASDVQAWTTKSCSRTSEDMLSHLDRNRGLVGSFRRNQQIAKHIGSLASHPSLRASTLEMNAMQSGRRGAANTPITPLRKKRGGRVGGLRKSPAQQSPLSKVTGKKRMPARGGFGFRR